MHIGERIALLRKRQGMTQEQLADVLGTTRQAVSKWEAGKSTPDIDYAVLMGEYFGVSMDYLLLGTSDAQGKANDTQDIMPHVPKNNYRSYWIIFIAALIVGICIMLMLPLIATIYRNYTFACNGRALTDAYLYISKWPLKGILLIGIGSISVGAGGVGWILYRKRKQETNK